MKCVFIFAGFGLCLTGCFTVHTHQTGKTLGKGESNGTFITGLSGVPSFTRDAFNGGNGPVMFPVYTYQYGIGEYSDIGAFLGITKMGALFKHQFLGNKYSKGALSIGFNAFLGSDIYLLSSTLNYGRTEIPLYLSFELTKRITVYASPLIAYNWEKEKPLSLSQSNSYHYLTRSLTVGCLFNLGEKFTLSPEIGTQNVWKSQNYQFYSTIGFGIKLSRPAKSFNFLF